MALVPLADEPRGFNYADLDEGVAKLARDTAEKFRNSQRRIVADAMRIGADLLKVKTALGHGRFTKWLLTEFPNHQRTAQRYMQVAERIPETKSDIVSLLPLGLVYKLIAERVPQVIDKVIADLEGGAKVGEVKAKVRDSVSVQRAIRQFYKSKKAHGAQEQESERAKTVAQKVVEECGLATVRRVVHAMDDCEVEGALRTLISETCSDDTAVSAEAMKAKLSAPDDLPLLGFLQRELPNPVN